MATIKYTSILNSFVSTEGSAGIMTNYEERFHSEGIPIHRCVAVKTEDRPATPVPEKKRTAAPEAPPADGETA